MKHKTLLTLATVLASALAWAEITVEPTFGKFRYSYSGSVVSFIAGSGTNTAVEVVYDGEIPWRLAEVTSTASTTTVSRVWQYRRPMIKVSIETNLFDTVITNQYLSGYQTVTYTNEVYDSTTDTLPDSEHFLRGDMMLVGFGTETGQVVRILGSTP
jgi:hypothetical protein